jgi:large repetitive protein
MTRYKSRNQYHSRLQQQESKRLKRQTVFIIVATIGLIITLVVVGIPALIKMAVFIGDIRNVDEPLELRDTIPPQTPQLTPPPEATSSASLSIIGFSEPAATVTLFQNNQEKSKTIVDATGKFEFLQLELNEGSNSFYAIAKDAAGNESQRSVIYTVNYDTEPPELTISSPQEGTEVVGITRQNIRVEGTTEAGAKLNLNGNSLVVRSDGSFTTQFRLEEGENLLNFTAEDAAGNQTQTTIRVLFSSQ